MEAKQDYKMFDVLKKLGGHPPETSPLLPYRTTLFSTRYILALEKSEKYIYVTRTPIKRSPLGK